jgi:hypothetical protein
LRMLARLTPANWRACGTARGRVLSFSVPVVTGKTQQLGVRSPTMLNFPMALIDARDLAADAPYDVVEVDVVFQRIGAGNIIIVRVLYTKNESGRLIDLPSYRRK